MFHPHPQGPLHSAVRRGAIALAMVVVVAAALSMAACEQAQQIAAFFDSISDGAACESDADCLGGRCLPPAQGYTNGYCTTVDCEMEGCSGFFAECFRAEIDSADTTACFELCDLDGTCDRAEEGYRCVTLQDTPVCLPPGATNAPPQGAIGSACSASAQCNGGEGATCLQTSFGGYCTILGCNNSADCPDREPCVPLDPMGESEEDKRFACMKGCASDDDCRFNYSCQDYEGERICLESEQGGARNPDGVDDGEPCVSNINCKGGTCIREAESADGGVSYPGGYCTTRDCAEDTECNGADSICISRERTTACRVSCDTDADCRTGYTCRTGATGSYCDSAAQPAVLPEEMEMSSDLGVTCQSGNSISFETPPGSVGFFIAAYAKTNAKVTLQTLRKPDGSTLNLQRDYSFLTVNQDILGNLAPILFPASDASQFADAFGGGSYTLTVNTSAPEVCYYVLPQPREGAALKLNLTFVGVPGVTADSAPDDSDIREMVQMMRGIYSKMGISVEIATYRDATAQVTQSYSILRDFYDVFSLVATSPTPQDPLSVNVFLIQDFNISDAPGLLGVSTGIPGMAGLHGSSGSGLVFSTASLGQDNATLGQTLAHEVGHFLGLRHTTEHLGSETDPITDTPSCFLPDLAFLCDDASNFMFPFSLGGDEQTRVSNGQGFVLRHSPLVRP